MPNFGPKSGENARFKQNELFFQTYSQINLVLQRYPRKL